MNRMEQHWKPQPLGHWTIRSATSATWLVQARATFGGLIFFMESIPIEFSVEYLLSFLSKYSIDFATVRFKASNLRISSNSPRIIDLQVCKFFVVAFF